LATSLAEDILSLMETQRSVLRNFVQDSKDCPDSLFEEGMLFVFNSLREHQMHHRHLYLITLQDACAAANDFMRVSERMEAFVQDLGKMMPRSSSIQQLGEALVNQFSQDAVVAAERSQIFIIRHVQQQTSLPRDLFSKSWEDDWTHNEVAQNLLKIFDEFLVKIERYLSNAYLYDKTLLISARGMICFYIRCLLQKAEKVGRSRRRPHELIGRAKPFNSPSRALRRMMDDIGLMREFFQNKTKDNAPLTRAIRSELNTLELIHDVLVATSQDPESLESFIVVLHKRTGADALVTKHFVGDLWLLVAQSRQDGSLRNVARTLDGLQPDLQMVTNRMQERSAHGIGTEELSFVRLDEMLKVLYEDRIVQGLLPVCWTCLPKDLVKDADEPVVTQRIRTLTRNVAELRWGKNKKAG
jgi:hypothetical protein